jgi:hypothetical protein
MLPKILAVAVQALILLIVVLTLLVAVLIVIQDVIQAAILLRQYVKSIANI